ncbi:MAG: glycosyltransferase [Acidobacteriia bacterium]|nr:glycosyltransferase [Terriglobia bacterium]
MLRILFIGENWYGSNARSCAEALRRLGCNVLDVDAQTFFPQPRLFASRVVGRLVRPRLVREFNDYILATAEQFKPDILLAFKGNFVLANTLKAIGARGAALYNYYPDTSAFSHGKWIPQSLPEYDCVFYTKPFWYKDVSRQLKLKAGCFVPHGYDPELHKMVKLDPRDIQDFGCDVSFIATHTAYKEEAVKGLLHLRPNLNLRTWGGGWKERCRTKELRRCVQGLPLLGESYTRAIQAAKINLAIMSGQVQGASQGDHTTSRTYIIPACGGFMLHERNPEVLGLYEEGKEIECFESAQELAEKIDYYLANPEERERTARAGHARCVPAYSYDSRMSELIRWHGERHGIPMPPLLSSVVCAGTSGSPERGQNLK